MATQKDARETLDKLWRGLEQIGFTFTPEMRRNAEERLGLGPDTAEAAEEFPAGCTAMTEEEKKRNHWAEFETYCAELEYYHSSRMTQADPDEVLLNSDLEIEQGIEEALGIAHLIEFCNEDAYMDAFEAGGRTIARLLANVRRWYCAEHMAHLILAPDVRKNAARRLMKGEAE